LHSKAFPEDDLKLQLLKRTPIIESIPLISTEVLLASKILFIVKHRADAVSLQCCSAIGYIESIHVSIDIAFSVINECLSFKLGYS